MLYERYEKRYERVSHSGLETGKEAFTGLILTN